MPTFTEQVNMFRRRLIISEIRRCHGNMSAAARALAIHRNTLANWMAVLSIPVDSHRHWGGRRPGAGRAAMPSGVGGGGGDDGRR